MIPFRFLVRLPFEISNKVTGSFGNCRIQAASKRADREECLACPHGLIYNKLIGYECTWALGIICLSPVAYKMFNHVRDLENMLFFFMCSHCNHSLEK